MLRHVVLIFLAHYTFSFYAFEVTTLFGSMTIHEPVLQELIESKAMQRLKRLEQYGITYYISEHCISYTRFDHSLGVLYFVRKAGGELLEQIAALLHDVSHLVFSHVAEYYMTDLQTHYFREPKDSYQDYMHEQFLQQTDIPDILNRYGISLHAINHKKNHFTILEQDLPALCADRIEYILHGAYNEGILDEVSLEKICASLRYNNQEKWYFDELESAKLCGYASLYLTEHLFTSAWNFSVYHWAGCMIQRGLECNLFSFNDLIFGDDETIWQLCCSSNDTLIAQYVVYLCNPNRYFINVSIKEHYNKIFFGKFRGIDPLVKVKNGYMQLTALDPVFKQDFYVLKDKVCTGVCVQFLPYNNETAL